jgi:hypothetical protein
MPAEMRDVLREIVRARMDNLLERAMPIHPETVGLWNALTSEGG